MDGINCTITKAFIDLLQVCLEANREENLAIIADESFASFQGPLDSALGALGLDATQVFVSWASQLRMAANAPEGETTINILPDGIRGILSDTDKLINALVGRSETLDVRKAILDHARPSRSRIAHMPNLDEGVLSLIANSPLDDIYDDSERVAWVLGEAKILTIYTKSQGAVTHKLTMDLEGWDNSPLMSPGKVLPGGWANVAPGETFVCPERSSVDGRVCVDGSIPGEVLSPATSAVLEFRDGVLVEPIESPESPVAVFLGKQRELASSRDDRYWNHFCEFGIGLNPTITSLTGNALYDEKMLCTAHIAIGDNSAFGHPIHSRVHHDLVFHNPTIIADDLVIMDNGVLNRAGIDSFRSSMSYRNAPISSTSRVFLRKSRYAITQESGTSVLVRCNRTGGRVSYVGIGDCALGNALCMLEDKMDTYADVLYSEFLFNYPEFAKFPTSALLSCLYHYRILAIGRV